MFTTKKPKVLSSLQSHEQEFIGRKARTLSKRNWILSRNFLLVLLNFLFGLEGFLFIDFWFCIYNLCS